MVRMPHWPEAKFQVNKIDLGRKNIKTVLDKLGNPHNKLPPVIHIAGTNGKGSTASFIRSIFEAHGKKVHLYTSPHLVRFNERIVVSGSEVSDDMLYQALERCRKACKETNIELTFFEATTAAAFILFAENEADLVILETGLGGRLDATNVIDNSYMSVITTISFDHEEYLGNSLGQIALEKAGIMRKGRKCIISAQAEEAYDALFRIAQQYEVKTYAYEYDFCLAKQENCISYESKNMQISFDEELGLKGDHQLINAATAIKTVEESELIKIDADKLIKGLKSVKWRGRLEQVQKGALKNQLSSQAKLYLDGAHNPAGALSLANFVAGKKNVLICGFTRNRNIADFLKYFAKDTEIIGVTVTHEPSSYSGNFIAEEAVKLGYSAKGFDILEDSFEWLSVQQKNVENIIICGSLFLVGEFIAKNENLKL